MIWLLVLASLCAFGCQGYAQAVPDLGENLALGRPYTMTPPNYSYSTDPDDDVQLTDGVYSEGHFWTRTTTVGWSGKGPTYINIDLGQDCPIKGLSFNSAAGIAEVRWPAHALIFLSVDGESWHEVGDLVVLHTAREPLPEYGEYHVVRLWTDQLQTHGRYVQLYLEPDGNYLFTDEIEVYRGEDAWLRKPYEGEPILDLRSYMVARVTDSLIQQQLLRDLEAVKADIAALPAGAQAEWNERVGALAQAVQEMPTVPMEGFRAVLPMTALERDIFGLQAAVWRAQGKLALRVWTKHRWDPLAPSEEPQGDALPPVVEVHMMNNEYRAGVLNLTNAADEDKRLQLRISGLPGGGNPDYVKVHEVLTVGTRRFIAVSAALPEADRVGDGYIVSVPSGMTRQVWLSFHPDNLAAGVHDAGIEITDGDQEAIEVPLRLHIYPLRFPDETTLLLGGWSYTNVESMYGVTPQSREAFIAHLQEHYVNAPWATSAALGNGQYDDAGNMTQTPDTANLDDWVALWPDAKMYMVFRGVTGEGAFDGTKPGEALFATKVGNWAHFWAQHVRDLGLEPSRLGILILDEPHSKPQYDVITAWARAIEAAEPELVTWEDPQPTEDQDCLEVFASVDVLCPYRNPFLARPDWYRELFLNQQRQGRELWFYNAHGPARCFDPFSFYLLQEWHCFKIGARGSCFWAFGDNGRVSCWNEYPATGNGPYCPIYLDDTSVTAAKYMEAIREGVQDYEYLTMLQARVDELEARGVGADRLRGARQLLDTACDRVMAMEEGANYRWDEEKDRTVVDQVRMEILQVLTDLAGG